MDTTPDGISSSLDFLFSDIQFLKGVGPKKGEILRKSGIQTVFDLFYYLPRRYLDRSQVTRIASLIEGANATILGTVAAFGIVRGRRNRFVVLLEDETDQIELVWFSGFRWLDQAFTIGDLLCVSGQVKAFGRFQITHPEFEVVASQLEETIHTGRLIPIYPGNTSLREDRLHSRTLRRIIKPALDRLAQDPCETIPEKWREEYNLLDLTSAIRQVHFPDSYEMADAGRQRLAFEELFYLELILAGRHKQRRLKSAGIVLGPPMKNGRRLLENLGFELTHAQVKVLNQIYADMEAKHQMNRLLQGDVGSGKTIVAVLAMLGAVESGYQAAIMAPTEILAEQHYYSISDLLRPLGISPVLLTSSIKGRERKRVIEAIASGECSIVIGTHALIEKKIEFAKLGLVVIDEQHRFGVAQRASLQTKGQNPDVLVMTATPIPRTLAMTLYGDLDSSVIDEMPPGRVPIITRYVQEEKRADMYDFIRRKIASGNSVYIVYPLIEQSEKMDLQAARVGYEKLKTDLFPDLRVGLLHGQMKGDDKIEVMTAFRGRKLDILVATSIIEVGLDVPSATIIVIEHAERFGLSQLHQMRGRVGRSKVQSYCFMLTSDTVGEDSMRRIDVLTSTTDGFKIAEADLDIRGPGEVLGTRQHGIPDLRVARLTDSRLVGLARDLAFKIVDDDPGLNKHRQILYALKKRLGTRARYVKIG